MIRRLTAALGSLDMPAPTDVVTDIRDRAEAVPEDAWRAVVKDTARDIVKSIDDEGGAE